jgi:CRISPR-associated exonuclease Cas4
MFSEDDLLPISALQHLLFCERQCALIHIERVWVENRLTVEGRHLHEKAHGGEVGPRGGGLVEGRGGVRIARAVPLRSLRLGLTGVADVVEFHGPPTGVGGSDSYPHPDPLPGRESENIDLHPDPLLATASLRLERERATAFPVEYKRGKPKSDDCDRVQLCAQGFCLEEMLGVEVPGGALFYGRTRHRQEVAFDTALRARTEVAAQRLHDLIASGRTPIARREPKCKRCSLFDVCLPHGTGPGRSALRYVRRALAAVGQDEGAA